jgi:hypothetical protein
MVTKKFYEKENLANSFGDYIGIGYFLFDIAND